MATSAKTADYILEQIGSAGEVSVRKMFGEYGVYCDGKMAGLICDDQLFIKPTAQGRVFAGKTAEKSPYPGAKPCLLISGERWDDADWLAELFRITAGELPKPKPKTSKPKKGSNRRT